MFQQEELAAAEWTLFVNAGNVTGFVDAINNSGEPFAHAVFTDLTEAQDNFGKSDASNWYVITPDVPDYGTNDTSPMQEFLFYSPITNYTEATSVPEPAAVVLLATIAWPLGFKFRRRRQA